ncbi:zinc finger protein 761-like [Anopheles darlingi]|uniref:zinc finger protein 761-like n=1 Tax=Anopheles darlingi TaxID=43151 RepID=UPI00210030FE|nr:zinc finger protein 761-like [Anopheles darlingi]
MEIIHFYGVRKRCISSDTVLHNERNAHRELKCCSPLNDTGTKENAFIKIEPAACETDHENDTQTGESQYVVEDDGVEHKTELAAVEESSLETDELEVLIYDVSELPEEGNLIGEIKVDLHESQEELGEGCLMEPEYLIETDKFQSAVNSDDDSDLPTDAQSNSQSESYAEPASEMQAQNCGDDSDILTDTQSNAPSERYAEEPSEDVLRFVCCGCKATEFNSQEELDAHRYERHQRYRIPDCVVRPFECELCYTRFFKEKQLTNHRERRLRRRKFVCISCGMGYFTSASLRRHEILCLGQEKLPCDVCGKLFRGKVSLAHHMKLHQQDKIYACTVCGKTFKSKHALPIHMVKHSAEQPFRCQICPAKFKLKQSLRNHELRHANPRPIKCDFCDEYFNNFAIRKYHRMTVHEGLDPYRCEECGISFRRKLLLKHHMEQTHGIGNMGENGNLKC